jgi:hypothetical protein
LREHEIKYGWQHYIIKNMAAEHLPLKNFHVPPLRSQLLLEVNCTPLQGLQCLLPKVSLIRNDWGTINKRLKKNGEDADPKEIKDD